MPVLEKEKNKEEKLDTNAKSFIENVLNKRALILILFGIGIRLVMLIYYYYTHSINPGRSWGDISINFKGSYYYPPLTMILLDFFKSLSFGSIEVFAFWGFLLDILTMMLFYFVLKGFKIKNIDYVFGLFLINPFLFLNNSFSLENCGYHITDAFFFFFLFMALILYTRKENWSRYLFYGFLAMSFAAKLYTFPVIGFFFLKFLIEKNWKEMKIFLISTIPIITIFLLLPVFYWENYLTLYAFWIDRGEVVLPLYIRIIPFALISGLYIIFRLRKADLLEITFVSIFVMATFMFFSSPYIRYFQALLFFGILTPKEFFNFKLNLGFIERDIDMDNNLLIFYSSFILVGVAYLIVIFIL